MYWWEVGVARGRGACRRVGWASCMVAGGRGGTDGWVGLVAGLLEAEGCIDGWVGLVGLVAGLLEAEGVQTGGLG